jgi:hypothetical protein
MPAVAPNVLPLAVAAERYGIGYATLRELVNAGVFTKHVFDDEQKKPALFVFVSEMEGWKRNKLDGVREAQAEARRLAATAPDLGGEG